MAPKEGGRKGKGRVGQDPASLRMLFLHRAASYLHASGQQQDGGEEEEEEEGAAGGMRSTTSHADTKTNTDSVPRSARSSTQRSRMDPLARQYLVQMHAIAMKTPSRLPSQLKRTTCKRCAALLVPGSTAVESMENRSKNQAKPWAAVRLVTCALCGFVKRYPVAPKQRSAKLAVRRREAQAKEQREQGLAHHEQLGPRPGDAMGTAAAATGPAQPACATRPRQTG
ncbi:hypothetical protein KEM52_000027 [Ascosphaera acerosa]|nr:hypothetical protein KEM52_000027 [Ascosphaera acerosa]